MDKEILADDYRLEEQIILPNKEFSLYKASRLRENSFVLIVEMDASADLNERILSVADMCKNSANELFAAFSTEKQTYVVLPWREYQPSVQGVFSVDYNGEQWLRTWLHHLREFNQRQLPLVNIGDCMFYRDFSGRVSYCWVPVMCTQKSYGEEVECLKELGQLCRCNIAAEVEDVVRTQYRQKFLATASKAEKGEYLTTSDWLKDLENLSLHTIQIENLKQELKDQQTLKQELKDQQTSHELEMALKCERIKTLETIESTLRKKLEDIHPEVHRRYGGMKAFFSLVVIIAVLTGGWYMYNSMPSLFECRTSSEDDGVVPDKHSPAREIRIVKDLCDLTQKQQTELVEYVRSLQQKAPKPESAPVAVDTKHDESEAKLKVAEDSLASERAEVERLNKQISELTEENHQRQSDFKKFSENHQNCEVVAKELATYESILAELKEITKAKKDDYSDLTGIVTDWAKTTSAKAKLSPRKKEELVSALEEHIITLYLLQEWKKLNYQWSTASNRDDKIKLWGSVEAKRKEIMSRLKMDEQDIFKGKEVKNWLEKEKKKLKKSLGIE